MPFALRTSPPVARLNRWSDQTAISAKPSWCLRICSHIPKVSWEYWLENWPEPQWRSAILIVQLLRVLDRNGAQADGVNELEDGGVGADSESEGQDGDEGEAGTETKKPQSMPKVAPERGHSIPLAVSDDGRDRMSRD